MTEDFRHGIDWQEACDGVPTAEPLDEGKDLSDHGDLEDVVESLKHLIGESRYFIWEVVIREEQGLPLSEAHEEELDQLINFGDDDEEDILYINEIPRPSEPWYETLIRVLPHILVEKLRSDGSHYEVITWGWPQLVEALEEHGKRLSLPEGVDDVLDVIPLELRRRLWLQSCLDELLGIGSHWDDDDVISLEQKEEHYRIDAFIEALRDHKDDIQALDLTLEKLWDILIMPPKERAIFVEMFTKALGLESSTDPIADHL